MAPLFTSHAMVAPSAKLSRPSAFTAEACRKTSGEPSSGVTKPKPFCGSNHFTLAVTPDL